MQRIEIKLSTDTVTAQGSFSGLGAVFGNKDVYGDVIAKGAFKNSLKEWDALGKFPPMLLQHGGMSIFGGGSPDGLVPIGVWDDMSENSKGLHVEGRLIAMDTDIGKRVHAAMKEKALDGLSIGFRTKQARIGTKPEEPRRTLTEIDLVEVSLVTFPANSRARVQTVKSLTVEQLRDLETALRDAELSRTTAAKAVAVFKAYLLRDAGVPTYLDRDDQDPAHQPTDVNSVAARLLASITAGSLRY